MAVLYERRVVVIVDTLRVDGLRVQFKAEKTLKKEPNTLDLSITNLSAQTRAGMQKKGAKVVVLAGHADQIGQIFAGDARTIDHVRKGPDWVTRIQCGDGERAYRYALTNKSFKAGTTVADVVKALANDLGIGVGNALAQIAAQNPRGFAQYINGHAAYGNAARELDKVLRTAGFTWSIQDGQLQLLRVDETTKDSLALFSPATGLIGSPEHGAPDKKGKASVLKVKALLSPLVRPGRRVKLESESATGVYRAEKVTHQGDTAGQDWYTDMELKPV